MRMQVNQFTLPPEAIEATLESRAGGVSQLRSLTIVGCHSDRFLLKNHPIDLGFEFNNAANKLRTAPLWGVRLHSRLMHDGDSVTLLDAILRHGGEAAKVTKKFRKLKPAEKEALLEFLRSL